MLFLLASCDSNDNKNNTNHQRRRFLNTQKQPHPVDIAVGKKIKLRRTLMGISQQNLGKQLGLTFQQIQKYEAALNRISASKLYEVSRALNVPVDYFFVEKTPKEADPNLGKIPISNIPTSALLGSLHEEKKDLSNYLGSNENAEDDDKPSYQEEASILSEYKSNEDLEAFRWMSQIQNRELKKKIVEILRHLVQNKY